MLRCCCCCCCLTLSCAGGGHWEFDNKGTKYWANPAQRDPSNGCTDISPNNLFSCKQQVCGDSVVAVDRIKHKCIATLAMPVLLRQIALMLSYWGAGVLSSYASATPIPVNIAGSSVTAPGRSTG